MSFSIAIRELWTGDHDNRRPLSALDRCENSHIHGRLELRFGDRVVPHLGFFGPDDVCLGDWMRELGAALEILDASETGEYVFDEGEQGQPAFRFARSHDELRLSIIDSTLGFGEGDDEWQNVATEWATFDNIVRSAMESFRSTVLTAAPDVGPPWWASVVAEIKATVEGREAQ